MVPGDALTMAARVLVAAIVAALHVPPFVALFWLQRRLRRRPLGLHRTPVRRG